VYLDADAEIDQIDLFAGVYWMCLLPGWRSITTRKSEQAADQNAKGRKILLVGDVIE
jgi:hypothetical protein